MKPGYHEIAVTAIASLLATIINDIEHMLSLILGGEMIVVTGASGQLGGAIVRSLARVVPPSTIAASMRDPSKGEELRALGVVLRRGDYEDPASLRDAFADADQVLLVSSNARATGGDPLRQHRAAIDAARDAGVGRIVYTSQMAADRESAFPPARDHAATEAMLAESGLAWTALRNGFYASSAVFFLGDVRQTGRLELPTDGKTAWTAHADLADAAAAILAQQGMFEGPTPPLTGFEALDLAALAGVITPQVERVVVDDERFRASLVDRGLPEGAVATTMGYYLASRNGEFVKVDPTLERLIGRKPTSIRQVLVDKLAA